MSFTSTPLGQDRRLDHQAFLKGTSFPYGTNNPPKRAPSINQPVPTSYAYGAPNLATRSAKPPSSSNQAIPRPSTDESEEERRARYTHLKQRNEDLASRPGSFVGPGIITTPPLPNEATLNPTSVNIASAFQVAASAYTMQSGTNTWSGVGNRPNVPRSTSAEYEQQTNIGRRLPIGQRRGGPGSKPPSTNKTVPNFRGSDAENERSGESAGVNGRGKSPFDHITDYAQRAVSQATFLMRQRSQEPEDLRPPSRQATDVTLVPHNKSNSYDYADEEEEYQEIQKSSRKGNPSAPKRNRMSMDNKAYRPTVSDEEEESDGGSDDDRRGRRRRKKRESGGGPLTNMPAIQYDKRKKRKGRSGKLGEEDVSVEDEQEQSHASEQRARRSTTPLQRQPSSTYPSAPPDSSRSFSLSGQANGSADYGVGLDSIPEVDEMTVLQTEKEDLKSSTKQRPRSRSRSRTRPARQSTIGGPLGKLVNFIYVQLVQVLAVIFLFLGRLVGFLFSILIREPLLFIRRHRVLPQLSKYAVLGVLLYLAINALKGFDVGGVLHSIGYRPLYVAPELPPGSIDELTSRLLKLESLLAGLQSDSISERTRLHNDVRKAYEIASRINQLEARIDKELTRMQKSGEDVRSTAFKGLESIHRDIRMLQTQQSELSSRTETPKNDEEARAKLRALEDRLGSVEGGVKEALELGQTAAKAGSAVVGAGSASHWWAKLGSGSTTGLTIKASDGSDVTQLIGQIVDQALMHYTADGIARADYALSSGGAYVIPTLTSPTLEIRPSYFFGLISGSSVYARSPVTALHHETALGYCWPFAGPQGHLGVKLATPVRITDFTIDHVPRTVSYDMRPAPRHMEVWGLVEGQDNLERLHAYRERQDAERKAAEEQGRPLPQSPPLRPSILPKNVEYMQIGSFAYDINSPHGIQTFSISDDVKDLGIDFGIVVLFVNDNWGMKEFTCLYRFRVHGERKLELPSPDP